jgi:hypothetical protein
VNVKNGKEKNMKIVIRLSEATLERLAIALEHRLRIIDTRTQLKRVQRRFTASQAARRKRSASRKTAKKA